MNLTRLKAFDARSVLALGVVGALLLFPAVAGVYRVSQLGKFLTFAILAISLDLVWGYTGVLSLGHAVFFGLGAYVMALTLKTLPAGYLYIGLIAAVALPALAGLGVGRLLFYRDISGPYFAIVTLAISLVAMQGAIEWYDVTGGFNGLSGVPALALVAPGGAVARLSRVSMYYVIVAALVGVYYLGRAIVSSPFGRLLVAIRDNEARAEFLGYDTARYKMLVFGLAGGLAGLSGGLYAPYVGFVSPLLLGFVFSTEALIWAAVGGRGTLLGPALGAVLINFVASFLSDVLVKYWLGIIGLLFVLVVVLFPAGLFPYLARGFRRFFPARVRGALTLSAAPEGELRPTVPEGAANLLEVAGVSKSFDGFHAIDSLDFTLREGELRCIVGPNGAGKTTLFGLISGGLRPTAGELRFRDRPIAHLKTWQIAALGIGRKFQIPNVFESQTVLNNLAVAAQENKRSFLTLLRRQSTLRVNPFVLELIDQTGLADRLETPAAQLSHGEKQWLEICMVLASRPRLLLLDEPTAGLTIEETRETARLVQRIYEALRLPMIVIEHDLSFVRDVGWTVTVLHRGQTLTEGTIEQVAQDQRVQAVYLGRSG